MSSIRLIAMGCCLLMASVAVADILPGKPRREFYGRTYFYTPVTYFSPVWYEPNGAVATRQWANTPLWPSKDINKRR